MLNIMKNGFLQNSPQSRGSAGGFPEPATRAVMADSDEQQCVHGEILCRHLLGGYGGDRNYPQFSAGFRHRLAEQGTLDEIALHNSETRRYMQELCGVLDDISEHADKGLDYTKADLSAGAD